MKLRTISIAVALLLLLWLVAARPTTLGAQASAVSVTEDGTSFTLSNGIVTVRILKNNGDIRSLQYKGIEILTDKSGHAGGYWSHDTTGGKAVETKVTIDPARNGGERAEVSVKGISGGIMVGLAQPVPWQTDAKHYQFWTRSDNADGTFTIPKVSPGTYTLCAFADGVLGEFSKANVQVGQGQTVNLGELLWEPVRRGRQIWEIGVANRTGAEFAGGDRFYEPDITLQYPKMFPSDVTYTIGQSQPGKDWFYAHVPRNTDPKAQVEPFRGVTANGQATPYTVRFRMDSAPRGTAVLRLAICGTGTRALQVSVNGNPAGPVQLGPGDGVITRHQVQGLWYERQFEFDAAQLKAGENTLTLTVPAGPVNNGVVYDYLRLELN